VPRNVQQIFNPVPETEGYQKVGEEGNFFGAGRTGARGAKLRPARCDCQSPVVRAFRQLPGERLATPASGWAKLLSESQGGYYPDSGVIYGWKEVPKCPVNVLNFMSPCESCLIGLLLTVVPISVVAILTLARSEGHWRRLSAAISGPLPTRPPPRSPTSFIERVTAVGMMAATPAVLDAAVGGNRSYQGMSDQAAAAKSTASRASGTPRQPIRSRKASFQPGLANAAPFPGPGPPLPSDHRDRSEGATVAATDKTLDYFQADEEFLESHLRRRARRGEPDGPAL